MPRAAIDIHFKRRAKERNMHFLFDFASLRDYQGRLFHMDCIGFSAIS